MNAVRMTVVKRLSALNKYLMEKDNKQALRLENEMFVQSQGCKQNYNQLITKVMCRICQMNTSSVANDDQFWNDVSIRELLDGDAATIVQKKKKDMESKFIGHLQTNVTGRKCIHEECTGSNVSYSGVQKHGADEPETLYFYCPDCQKSWQDEE